MSELRTPTEWCEMLGARIADPDGWRDGTRAWDEPIDRVEFDRRLIRCTIDVRGYPDFVQIPTSHPNPREADDRERGGA